MAKTKNKSSKEFYQNVGLSADPNKKRIKKGPTEFVAKLEKEANQPVKKKFKFSKVMCEELAYYIKKYGDDFESMARDKKNIYQDSPGQLRYKIKKYQNIHLNVQDNKIHQSD